MPHVNPQSTETFQARFHRRWHHLNDPHVRALAWLLDSPDLLDLHAPQWRGRIASLTVAGATDYVDWLAALDQAPASLHAALALQPHTRLGRYAEQLMAFYFASEATLVAHGLQIQSEQKATIGEFDFLLRDRQRLLHWEFATKFYLLESSTGRDNATFIGPNLADTLNAKMSKILDKQLALSRHPAAQAHLPQPVDAAQALIKGWLFYHKDAVRQDVSTGVASAHCCGFWCALEEWQPQADERYLILPRLHWLAPARVAAQDAMDAAALAIALRAHFASDSMPVLIAALVQQGEFAVEVRRGFVVPDDWRQRAGLFLQLSA